MQTKIEMPDSGKSEEQGRSFSPARNAARPIARLMVPIHARVRRVVFGAFDPRLGAAGSVLNVFARAEFNHRVDVFGGVLMEGCAALLKQFFEARR